MEGPSRTRVALVRSGLHHLDIVRRKQVPQELPTPVRRQEEVQVLVGSTRGLDQTIQFGEDPFVRGKMRPVFRFLERGDETGDVPELRDKLRGASDFRFADPEVLPWVRLARGKGTDRVRPVLLDQGPWIDHVAQGAVHRAATGVEAEPMDENAVERV